jgi:Protein of unknown function (DUF1570)
MFRLPIVATALLALPPLTLLALAPLALAPPALDPRPDRLGGDGPPAQLTEARTLLDGGQAKEALEKAKVGLELAPDLPEMLDVASRAAQAAGSADEALWYAWIASGELGSIATPTKEQKALADGIQKRLGELDPTGQQGSAAVSSYAAALFAIGKDCAARKLTVNAVDLFLRCRGTPTAAAAEAELAKIYDNKKAVESLIESGLDVPVKAQKKRSPESAAKEDAKHATWASAWEVKGEQYTVVTDFPRETADSISLAMEQMNRFYRKVFHVKEFGGGQTARVKLCVYRSREEFDANYVATYDPRSDKRPLSELWSTLFHESSHQFTHMISADLIPAWLNEGTASYFEGAKLQGNGVVETNLVPEERLGSLEVLIQRGSPTLEQVVTYFQPGSYPGEYYPFGWGLVYFLLNYEDEKSQRVYVQPYQGFIASYKSGGKHDVKGRFVEHFVTKAKQPGVASFADFEKRWKDWIHELHGLYYGGPEVADKLIERARKETKDKAYESAAESYGWALRKRPGDPVASFELAELLALQKANDAAIYRYRGAVATLRVAPDLSKPVPGAPDRTGQELLDLSASRLAKLDKAFADAKSKADEAFAGAAADAARGYMDKSMPLCALRLLDQSGSLYGGATALLALREEIAGKSGADTRRWRRLKTAGELAEWEVDGDWKAPDGALVGTAEKDAGPIFCFWRDDMPERFRFEARVDASDLDKEDGLFGLVFAATSDALRFLGVQKVGVVSTCHVRKGPEFSKPIATLKPDQMKSFTLAIEVFPGRVEFFVDGKPAGKPMTLTVEEMRGKIGLVLQGGSLALRELRVRS